MSDSVLAQQTQKALGLRGVYGFRNIDLSQTEDIRGNRAVAFMRLDTQSSGYVGLGTSSEEAAADAVARGGKEPYAWVLVLDTPRATKKLWSKLYSDEKENSLLIENQNMVAISTKMSYFTVDSVIGRASVEHNVQSILLR